MADKAFRVRHGLVVANDIINANNTHVGVNTASAAVTLHVAANDAILVPIGNTGQRPSSANGLMRYNSETNSFEGYANGAWGAIGGAGGGFFRTDTGGNTGSPSTGPKDMFRINANTLNANVTFVAGENATAAGPIDLNGYTLTINSGARVSIV